MSGYGTEGNLTEEKMTELYPLTEEGLAGVTEFHNSTIDARNALRAKIPRLERRIATVASKTSRYRRLLDMGRLFDAGVPMSITRRVDGTIESRRVDDIVRDLDAEERTLGSELYWAETALGVQERHIRVIEDALAAQTEGAETAAAQSPEPEM